MWLYLLALLVFYFLCRWYRERQTVKNLIEKYVFITGCDSGFGNQLARQLDTRGIRVLSACLTQKGADDLKKATSGRLKTTILDVTSMESIAAATEWVKESVGDKGLWGLVNNAGVGSPLTPNEWLTKEDFENVIRVNLLGLIDGTLHMLPMVRRARGRVVNVASMLGRLAFFGGGYCPSKYGVEAFSDSLRRELIPFGVQVSIIEPGGFATSIGQNIKERLKSIWNQASSDVKEAYGQQCFEKYYRMHEFATRSSTNLRLVTDKIEHALTSCHPRTRYSAGWDAKLFFLPFSYLPTSLTDYVLTRFYPRPAQAV
nr:17-beta-hydroxysteroid dehydrogenase type 6-like isoform X1 [Pogona vitticeps]XP_020671115.1 17-beta-hydroxysteroid dehydrogenase type 6-like isoform X1 [Pogona vitticeps]XP_020671116.1 17-beta-hydroxysteroid dehydrogenase type 6-like isoform X1 [Pogona vitticeps]XP_020671117.1 17-beta-hydroxysteroid dehydrogenase type 6-like isoform X1 [Pogona vitticeps]